MSRTYGRIVAAVWILSMFALSSEGFPQCAAAEDNPIKKGEKPPAVKPGVEKPALNKLGKEKPGMDKSRMELTPAPGKGKPLAKPIVRRESKREVAPVVAAIDREVSAALSQAKVPTSPQADDAEFLRRACLDITGRIPTIERTLRFLASEEPHKRAQLVDELVSSRENGQHFGDIWRNLVKPRDTSSLKYSADRFGPWLADQFNANRSWGEIVSVLLTTETDLFRDPEATFLQANSEESAPKPSLLAASTGRLFLGVQIGCAECHNHPFAEWKQTDFWSTAGFFSRVRKRSKGDSTLTEAASENIQSPAAAADEPSIVIPDTAGKGAGKAVPVRFLGGGRPALSADGPWRPALAAWITQPDNPYFARAFVNRLWAHFFARGLVMPVDDLRAENPPSHPALLDLLAQEFIASDYDIQHLIRCIAGSQAYQRTSRPLTTNEADTKLLSHMAVKVMTPEVLYESLHVVANAHPLDSLGSMEPGKKPFMKRNVVILEEREAFIRLFGAAADTEKGDQFSYGIPQWLRYMNARQLNISPPLIKELTAASTDVRRIVESIYLVTLSRRPTEAEQTRMVDFVAAHEDPEQAYAGVLWILLNSSEFVVNR